MKKYLKYVFLVLIALVINLTGCNKKKKEKDPIIYFSLKSETINLVEGESSEIEYVCFENEKKVDNPTISFEIENPEIVSINNNVLNALSVGQTKINATYKGILSTSNIIVSPLQEKTYILDIQDDAYYLYLNETVKINYILLENDVQVDKNVSFVSNDESIVTVDRNGIINPKKVGNTSIKVSYGNSFDIVNVFVESSSSIILSNYELKLGVNDDYSLSYHFPDEIEVDENIISLSSNNEDVCKIKDGKIIALSKGKTNIKVKYGSLEAQCKVQVYDHSIKTIDDFMRIKDDLKADYFLYNDLDFQGINYVTIAHYNDSKNASIGFAGLLDGNGKTIKNLDISYNSVYPNSNALIGVITSTGIVENLNVEVSGNNVSYSGTICNINQGTIRNCYTKIKNVSSVDNSSYAFGGIANQNRGKISSCIVDYSAATTSGNMAGLIGRVYSTCKCDNCFVIGDKVSNIIFNFNNCNIDVSTCHNVSSYEDIYNYDLSALSNNWVIDNINHSLPYIKGVDMNG